MAYIKTATAGIYMLAPTRKTAPGNTSIVAMYILV